MTPAEILGWMMTLLDNLGMRAGILVIVFVVGAIFLWNAIRREG